jgi:hypothetical protein
MIFIGPDLLIRIFRLLTNILTSFLRCFRGNETSSSGVRQRQCSFTTPTPRIRYCMANLVAMGDQTQIMRVFLFGAILPPFRALINEKSRAAVRKRNQLGRNRNSQARKIYLAPCTSGKHLVSDFRF